MIGLFLIPVGGHGRLFLPRLWDLKSGLDSHPTDPGKSLAPLSLPFNTATYPLCPSERLCFKEVASFPEDDT